MGFDLSSAVAGYRGYRQALDNNERRDNAREDREWMREQRDVTRKTQAMGLESAGMKLDADRSAADERKRRESFTKELTSSMMPTPNEAPASSDVAAGAARDATGLDGAAVVRAPGGTKGAPRIQAGSMGYFQHAYGLASKYGLRDEMEKAAVGVADLARQRFEKGLQQAAIALESGDPQPLVNHYNAAFPDGRKIVKASPVGPDGLMEITDERGNTGKVDPRKAVVAMLDPKKWAEMSAKFLEQANKAAGDKAVAEAKGNQDRQTAKEKGAQDRQTEGVKTQGRIKVEKEKGAQDRQTAKEKGEKAPDKAGLDAARMVRSHLATDAMGGMTGENSEIIDDAAAEAERLARAGTAPAEAAKQGIDFARRKRATDKNTRKPGSPAGGTDRDGYYRSLF